MKGYDKRIDRNWIEHAMPDNFRRAKSLLMAPTVLIALTIVIIIFTPRLTRIHAGLFALKPAFGNHPTTHPSTSAFPVWVSPSLSRVGQTDAPGTTSSITLSGARGETVDTQVIVQGTSGGLSNLNLTASALTAPGGARNPPSPPPLFRQYPLSLT